MQRALPIDDVLGALKAALVTGSCAVVVAPPGAGKTTRVPPALLGEPWLAPKSKILLLEPRRIAARGAATFMAKSLGEDLGQTIGLRARLTSKVGPNTRIEVITEGVFTRMIIDDPALEGIGAVLFDEFHERSLDADLGLALALDAQAGLRPDLRLVVMSATLDVARVAEILSNAPVIESHGRAFPVETRYLGRDPRARIEDQMVAAIERALRAETGSILAFLPGQGEIRRVETRLSERLGGDSNVDIATLHGGLDMDAQSAAIRPARVGRRKIVLATSIAETSLTIEGVRVVIDCGLARVPRYEPDAGVTRLDTVRVSRAAADQRRGRAGRTEPGVAYRLWDEPETQALAAFATPEIRSADLTGLVLDCAAWGVADPRTLAWLDPPTRSALEAARAELADIGALDARGQLSDTGKRLRAMPLPPRLARMVLTAADRDAALAAAEIAAVIVERGLGGNDPDLDQRLAGFRRDRTPRAQQMRRLAEGWADQARRGRVAGHPARVRAPDSTAALLALAFPDRIAKARAVAGQFILAGGRGAVMDAAHPLARAPFLLVADMSGAAAGTRILLAAILDETELPAIAGDRLETRDDVTFDAPAAALRGRRTTRLGAIRLAAAPLEIEANETTAAALARGIATLGIERLPWSKVLRQLRDRVGFLRTAAPEADWPDLSDAALASNVEDWLAPVLGRKTRLDQIGADDLETALAVLLPWALMRRLDDEAPTHFQAPTGNRHAVDYDGPQAPSISLRAQELFGLKTHPAIARGRLALTLELLSPAGRPIQITRDLPGFWAGSWRDVKADMRGRYPRHPWPDDPANAAPTARAKPRGT